MISRALGRIINQVYPANGVYLNLRDAAGVSFLVFEATTATQCTITFASDSSGTGAVTPVAVTEYFGATNATSGGIWHRTAVTTNPFSKSNSGEDRISVEVLATSCPDGKPWVKLTANGSGLVVATLHDLAYQRAPELLRSVTV